MSLYDRKYNGNLPSMRMGVVIDNNTDSKKNVWFLGGKQKRVRDVELSNMFADTFMDDDSLTMLKNWLIAIGEVEIAVIRFTSDGLRSNLGSNLTIHGIDANNNDTIKTIAVWRWFHPEQHSDNVLDIPERIMINASTSFNIDISAYGKVAIVFIPSNNIRNIKGNGYGVGTKNFDDMYEKLKEDNKELTENKRKKYLLLC